MNAKTVVEYPYAEKCKKTDKNRTVRYKQKALSEL